MSSIPASDEWCDDGATTVGVLRAKLIAARAAVAAARATEVAVLAEAGRLAAARAATVMSRRDAEREMHLRSISAELACAVRIADRSMQARIGNAETLVDGFPATFDAWRAGRISEQHASAIVDLGLPFDNDARRRFEDTALPLAETETPGRLRSQLATVAERMHPRTLQERHLDARAGRCVRVRDLSDGMSELFAILPSVLTQGAHDRLTQQAKAVKDAREIGETLGATEPDTRTTDQLRADIFADMLLTGTPDAPSSHAGDGYGALGAIRAVVQVTVPALSILGATDEPGDLTGRAPIDPDTARQLAGASCTGWDRVLTHPVTSAVLAVDRYRPSEDLRRFLRARDRHCRFPGCRMPARRCDIDHTQDAAQGGDTTHCNLACLCRRHHTLKHAAEWHVRQLPGGILAWTTPSGATYIDHPPPAVTFVPDPDPPPEDPTAAPPPDDPAPF